jgi:hypothetical protein
MESKPLPPSLELDQLITGMYVTQALAVVAKLGVADLLADAPQAVEQLAIATDTHAPSLYRVLRMLASLGVFAEDEQGRFGLTTLAEYLRRDVPGSRRAYAILRGDEAGWRPWGELLYSVKTGQPAFEQVFGMGIFQYLAQHPGTAALWDQAMVGRTSQEEQAVLTAYDFAGIRTIVDVGGGYGSLLAAALNAYPEMCGVLFDSPRLLAEATERLAARGVLDRCTIIGGDFFQGVPEGGDLYILKHVIHDWDDERAVAILEQCRRAIRRTAKLLLVEMVIPAGNTRFFGKLLDVQMLVSQGGRERSESEYQSLITAAGFGSSRVIPASPVLSVIEALPV